MGGAGEMSRTEREELDYQYSPSRWSTRLPAAAIVDEHCAITLANTKVARETLECDLGIEYLEPGGPVLDIYHPQTTTGRPSLHRITYTGQAAHHLFSFTLCARAPATPNCSRTHLIFHSLAMLRNNMHLCWGKREEKGEGLGEL